MIRHIMFGLFAMGLVFSVTFADGQQIRIEVTNLQPNDGFYLTPFWVGIHDGSFDFFDAGSAASASLEALAEGGDVSGLQADFNATQAMGTQTVLLNPAGFGGAPIIDPGETATSIVNVLNPSSNRYFSFASMIIPSNDGFFGNDNGMLYELFDNLGNFNGPLTINLLGGSIWDSGTEVNNPMGGAAFSALGGTSLDEGGVVAVHTGFDDFLGTNTAAGTTIGSIPGAATPFVTIRISAVPEPSAFMVLGTVTLGMMLRRRRKQ